MSSRIGQTLREARTQQGIELSEVERVTKIRVKFLRAMEEDRWEALPARAYARGFLSTYARFLGLDEEALVDEYRRTAEGADRVEPIPPSVLRPGYLERRRSIRRPAMLLTGLVCVVALALVVVASLGGSEGGNGGDREGASADSATRTTARQTEDATASETGTATDLTEAPEVLLELHSTGAVWVCLVDDQGRAPVNGETLTAEEVRGPFTARAFKMTLGNGSVEMTVNGEAVEVPALAEPLGYRVTASGVRRLDPAEQPTCPVTLGPSSTDTTSR